VVSVGSTPTAHVAESLAGVTEVRAGVFVFFDLVMAGLGVCTLDDIALSVLATVIGHRSDKRHTFIDAGWMALSRDRGTASQAIDQGYGVVCDATGCPFPHLVVKSVHQEHGIIEPRSPADPDANLPIGSLVRILPNHACATAAQHQHYLVMGDVNEGASLARWPRIASGW
jgi:D-serine deaminase-like pyridoxal phosphate-dependent protein